MCCISHFCIFFSVVSSYGNVTEDVTQQFSSPELSSSSNRILSALYTNTRNKRFLEKSRSTNDRSDSVASDSEDSNDISFSVNVATLKSTTTKNSPWAGVSSSLIISNFYTGDFIYSNAQLCNRKKSNITLLVLVPSAVSNSKQRDSVRKTWGSFSLRKDVAIGFMVGE